MKNKFDTIEEAIKEIKNGKIIIVVDDENRENEWDFVMASEYINSESINFMSKEWRGLICVTITEEIAKNLNLNLMCENNTDMHYTNFTVSIDHKLTNTSWISAFDRANTIKAIINKNSKWDDFSRPWHTFPLIAKKWWVLERQWHTEASLDLAKLAWLETSWVICEILNEDWSMARVPDLFKIAKKHNLKFITIKDLISYIQKQKKISI